MKQFVYVVGKANKYNMSDIVMSKFSKQ